MISSALSCIENKIEIVFMKIQILPFAGTVENNEVV
jgi:hypothetical protein